MDLDDFRSFILDSGIDVWTWIDMAISVASSDHEKELKNRRDGIIQKLYSPAFSKCQNCDNQFSRVSNCNGKETEDNEIFKQNQDVGFDYNSQGLQSEQMAAMNQQEEEGEEEEGEGEEDNEQREILEIKNLLNCQGQTERRLIDLLQRLVDMNITFKALKETDIGRHVTQLRKHSSDEVRRLVKTLVRKWKDTVDEWVRLSTPEEELTQSNDHKKSPHQAQMKNNIQNGGVKAEILPHRNAQNASVSYNMTPPKGKMKDTQIESDKLALSSTKNLHENHQESQKAKKQRTAAQIMDFGSIPKVKKVTDTNNGGSSIPVKYW